MGSMFGFDLSSTNQASSGTESVTKIFDPVLMQALKDSLATPASSAQLGLDADAASAAASKQFLQDNMSQVSSAFKGAGGYNASTAALMTNDLATRGAGVAAKTKLDYQNQAKTSQAQLLQGFANLLSSTADTRRTGQQQTSQNSASLFGSW